MLIGSRASIAYRSGSDRLGGSESDSPENDS